MGDRGRSGEAAAVLHCGLALETLALLGLLNGHGDLLLALALLLLR
jgi:hypothetical protein